MEYCDCGAPLAFSPDGVHCLGCYETMECRLEREEIRMVFQEYCRALQAVVPAGVDVRTVIDGVSCGMLHVAMVEGGTLVCHISSESSEEQKALLPL